MSDPPIPLSALEHYEYCPRQCALIHVDGLWADNRHTIIGQRGHRRADSSAHKQERGRKVLRSVPLWSEALNLTGRADIVEVWPDGTVVPVEYKSGSQHGLAAHIQLCAQALCLTEMLHRPVLFGFLWFTGRRRRLRVEFAPELQQLTLARIRAVAEMMAARTLPPAPDDERCDQCQLHSQCLPELVAHPHLLAKARHPTGAPCG
jgi:CRISPR-associated exonuclease Cas4